MRESDGYLKIQLGDEVCTTDSYREINASSVMCEREPLDLSDKTIATNLTPHIPYTWGVH